jgi:hypothetical protein
MEFKKVNEEIERLTLLEKNDSLTVYGSDLIVELKTLLEQRAEMLEMLKIITLTPAFEEAKDLYGKSENHWTNKIEQLIKKATEI